MLIEDPTVRKELRDLMQEMEDYLLAKEGEIPPHTPFYIEDKNNEVLCIISMTCVINDGPLPDIHLPDGTWIGWVRHITPVHGISFFPAALPLLKLILEGDAP